MSDHLVVRRLGRSPALEAGLAGLLTAYHLQTEAEKGEPVAEVAGLPDRYRAEIEDRKVRSPTRWC